MSAAAAPVPACITLLSDFGLRDGYVGMMKAAIAQIVPTACVIDLTHEIPPQNIAHARFVLMSSFPYFPVGTIHVAVVDPGVGSDRRGVAIAIGTDAQTPVGYVVGPDNGLFSGVLAHYPAIAAVELTEPQYWRSPQTSATFHGRDIFAPVAAHLARGVSLSQLGSAIAPADLVWLHLPPLIQTETSVQGTIQAIDHFGNLITTIPADRLTLPIGSVQVGTLTIPAVTTYSDRPADSPVALIGSHGWLEVAIVNGNAHAVLKMGLGDRVTVHQGVPANTVPGRSTLAPGDTSPRSQTSS